MKPQAGELGRLGFCKPRSLAELVQASGSYFPAGMFLLREDSLSRAWALSLQVELVDREEGSQQDPGII